RLGQLDRRTHRALDVDELDAMPFAGNAHGDVDRGFRCRSDSKAVDSAAAPAGGNHRIPCTGRTGFALENRLAGKSSHQIDTIGDDDLFLVEPWLQLDDVAGPRHRHRVRDASE